MAQPHSASRFLWFLRSPAEPLKPVSRPKSSAEKACGPFSRNEQDFVIGGYTDPAGSRSHFGALLAGFYKSAKLQFAGKVGTGFNEAWLRRLHSRFTTIARDDCPFSNLPEARPGHYGAGLTAAEMRRCYWIQPTLVCQIKFSEWTRDDKLRQPVFLGMREDKDAAAVVSKMSKSLRHGKVFVDWSQNNEHKTTVNVYSLGARERPTVSTPLTWKEVQATHKRRDTRLLTFEADAVLKRVEKLGDLFAPVLTLKQKLPKPRQIAPSTR